MNLRNWGKQHTIGLFLGIATTVACIFIVAGFFAWKDGLPYSKVLHRFTYLHVWTTKILSLASIGNLIWFHTFLRQENWKKTMGVIMATVISLLIIIYFKFFA